MAVNFAHNAAFSSTVLGVDLGSQPALPFSFMCWFKPTERWGSTNEQIITLIVPGGHGDAWNISARPTGLGDDNGNFAAIVSDFVYSNVAEVSQFIVNEWNIGIAVFEGSGNTPTSVTPYVNGVAGTPLTSFVGAFTPTNTSWIYIGGKGPTDISNHGFIGCLAHAAAWRIALSAAQCALLAAGTLPNDHVTLGTSGADLIGYWALEDEATATVATVGPDLTLYDDPPNGVISTCSDSPEFPIPAETGESECGSEDEADALASAIDWPECVLTPQRIMVQPVASTVSPGRAFSGHEQSVQADPGCWRIDLIDIPIRTRAHVLQWRELESSLGGRTGVITIPVYEGRLSSVDIAAIATADFDIGETLIGIEQTAGESIQAGMHFSIAGRLYRIKTVLDAEGGAYSVSIFPPLREAISQSDALEFNVPKCRCRLGSDDGMNINLELLRYATPSITFVEDV